MKLMIFPPCVRTLFLAAAALGLAACSGLAPAPTATPKPVAETATETATIVWFPSTDTPTLFPTQPVTPTLDYHPGLGSLIFSDSFDQPSLWDTSTAAAASASVVRNRLVLTVNGPGPLSILSLRNQPVLGDFYAQAQVDVSLCSGQDQYGMIFRAAPGGNYYRFSVNCSGQVRPERSRNDSRLPLQDWRTTGDAPVGAPAEITIGVWAVGNELRFFLNDHYQFTLHDPVFSRGTLGFFAYASGNSPVTVSFSELAVYAVSYLPPTSTPVPTHTP
jgi:hypothetical protein